MTTNSTSVQAATGLIKASRAAYKQKLSFLGVFAWVMLVSTGIAGKLDVLPNPPETAAANTPALAASPLIALAAPEEPVAIEIPSLDIEQTIKNPKTTNVAALDQALLTGVVRYPTSALLGAEGNVIIFGHSSYLPIVNNKAFKAFNGIQKLEKGDRIVVTGSTHSYVYAVTAVKQESATKDAIPLTASGYTLTLATCDSFGSAADRFVVVAELVETNPL